MSSFKSAETKYSKTKNHTFAYREIGDKSGIPLVLLHHLTAVLDDWDPAVIDGLAKKHHVVAFDNTGVGKSDGTTPNNVLQMARDAEDFIGSLGLKQVDLLGYSLGGFIAQQIAIDNPTLIRKLILAGTGPAGGEGISNIGSVMQTAMQKAGAEKKHPKNFLFFSQSRSGQAAAAAFLARLSDRKEDLDAPVSNETIGAQITAIAAWGAAPANEKALQSIKHPVLVANGDHDIMFPTVNTIALYDQLPNATLSVFPDASHGGIFQYHEEFVSQTLDFLAN